MKIFESNIVSAFLYDDLLVKSTGLSIIVMCIKAKTNDSGELDI